MKIEKDACDFCWGITGEMETFERVLLMHRLCYDKVKAINPKIIDEIKEKDPTQESIS